MENWVKYLLVLLGIGIAIFLYIFYLRNKKTQSKSQQRKRKSSSDFFQKKFGWDQQKIRKVKEDNYLDYFQKLKRYRKNQGSRTRANYEIRKLKRLSETGDYPRLKKQLNLYRDSLR